MNMKLLAVVTSPYIYHVCSTQKMFWEEIFTLANMNKYCHRNARKHRDIKNGVKYIILEISLDFGILDKIRTTSLEPKEYLGIPGTGLITSMGLKTIRRSNKKRQGMPLLMSD